MINMFSQMAGICHFGVFFMSWPEPSMGISSVSSFQVWSGGSLIIIFQLFRCRNLALNRIFLLFLRGRHIFTLRGASICSHMFICSLYIQMPPYVPTPPVCPLCSPVHPYVLGDICM